VPALAMLPSPLHPHNMTLTSTQGILNCFFSAKVLSHSNVPLLACTAAEDEAVLPPPALLFSPSNAALARLPPVPLIAAMARLAVSASTSVAVAFPESKELAVSVMLVVEGCHRGSNQSALKSKREKTRTRSRMLQYTQGLDKIENPVRKRTT